MAAAWPDRAGDPFADRMNEIAKYDQELAYLGPADYAQACRDAFAKERMIVERMGLSRHPG